MKIMGIDPALGTAGVATLSDEAPQRSLGRLLDCWRVNVTGETVPERAVYLARELHKLVLDELPDVIVMEMPADPKRGGRGAFRGRSTMTVPTYGIAVGGTILMLEALRLGHVLWGVKKPPASWVPRVLHPSVNDWTGRDVPSTRWARGPLQGKEDRHKEQRVAYVHHLYGLAPGSLGPISVAGNAADAVLIARWGMWKVQDGA